MPTPPPPGGARGDPRGGRRPPPRGPGGPARGPAGGSGGASPRAPPSLRWPPAGPLAARAPPRLAGGGGGGRRRRRFGVVPNGALLAAPLVDRFLQLLGGLETNALAGFEGDRLAGGGVAALARRPLGEGEAAKAWNLGALARLDGLGDGGEHRFERLGGLPPGEPLHGVHNAIDQVSFTSHLSSSLDSFFATKVTGRDDKPTAWGCQWAQLAEPLTTGFREHRDREAVMVVAGEDPPPPRPQDALHQGRRHGAPPPPSRPPRVAAQGPPRPPPLLPR